MFVSLHKVSSMMVSRIHGDRVYVTLNIVVDDVVDLEEAFDEFIDFVRKGWLYLHDTNSVAFGEIPKLFSVVSGSVDGGLDE